MGHHRCCTATLWSHEREETAMVRLFGPTNPPAVLARARLAF